MKLLASNDKEVKDVFRRPVSWIDSARKRTLMVNDAVLDFRSESVFWTTISCPYNIAECDIKQKKRRHVCLTGNESIGGSRERVSVGRGAPIWSKGN